MGQNTRCIMMYHTSIMMYFIIFGALVTSSSLDTNAIPGASWIFFQVTVAMSSPREAQVE